MKTLKLGHIFLLGGLWGFAALQSCDCEDDLVKVPTASCDLSTQCKDNQSYRHGKCLTTYCDEDHECCPGYQCNTMSHACQSVLLQQDYRCRSDRDCFDTFQDSALRCWHDEADPADPENPPGTCAYRACENDEDCQGLSCYAGWCLAAAPCGGACPEGSVCEVGTGTCFPTQGQKACEQVCDPGQILLLDDPEVMIGETCCPLSCHCATLPPLQPGVVGRFASLAMGSNELLVSAYDESFGDLVVAHYTGQGDLRWYSYVDGVPATGALGGDPNGPRSGMVAPGPDVGQYSSLVVNSRGEPRVAYYDVDNGDLRVAIFDLAAGGWSLQVVDAEQDAGRYASMVIDPLSDLMRITYMVSGLSQGGQDRSELRVATARVPEPSSAADWDIELVDSANLAGPCQNGCSATQRCVLEQGQAQCLEQASACASCVSAQDCVDVDGQALCRASLPVAVAGLPDGLGLFSHLSHAGNKDLVVYYDKNLGALKAAFILDSGPRAPVLIDGDGLGSHQAGNVGLFPSAAYDPVLGQVAIAYQDLSGHSLRLYEGDGLVGGHYSTIENGASQPPGRSFVGADSQLAWAEDGSLFAVYQDSSMMDLKMAQRLSGSTEWSTRGLLTEGAYGFDADIVLTPNVAYIVSAAPRLNASRRLASRLMLFVYPR